MRLALRGRALELSPGRPALMGIVNASPDSFSDPPGPRDTAALAERARELAAAGAAVIDVGGESGRTDRAPVGHEEEARRVVGLIEVLAGEGLAISVDTWRAPVARAALDAGAAMVNDVSGLADPDVAEACARAGAALVITHTRAAPKTKAFPGYDDLAADVLSLWRERIETAKAAGLEEGALLLDPGLDLAKTPAQTVELLGRLGELSALGRPLLIAISRKDFVGAITGRPPADRGAGTLAAVEPALEVPSVLRVHDVAGAADFLAVRAALRGDAEVPGGPLATHLRREPAA